MAIQATPDVIRAWTDEGYRRTLSHDELAHLPIHPAGDIALLDADIRAIYVTDSQMSALYSELTISAGPCCPTDWNGPCGLTIPATSIKPQ